MHVGLLSFVHATCSIVSERLDKYSSKYSKKTFTQPQLVVLNLIRIRQGWTYRETVDLIGYMTPIREVLGLETIPHWTTLQKAFDRINCWRWRLLLKESVRRLNPDGKAAIDASGFNRRWSSHYYTKRTGMRLKALKVTFLSAVGGDGSAHSGCTYNDGSQTRHADITEAVNEAS